MMICHTKSSINSLLTAGPQKKSRLPIDTITGNFHLGSNNLNSENRRARFLVERERAGFAHNRSRHVLATKVYFIFFFFFGGGGGGGGGGVFKPRGSRKKKNTPSSFIFSPHQARK